MLLLRHNIFYILQKAIMKRNNDKDNKRNTGIPENDPSKAMDSKREVEQSNDPKTDQGFPGYPHYPAKEDIMDQRTGSHKVDMDMENLASAKNATGVSQRFARTQGNERNFLPQDQPEENNDLNIRSGTDADVNDDDLAVLDDRSRDIIQRRWLDDGNKATLQDLADEYGVSAERIRQIEANAMKKMRGLFATAA